MARKVQLLKYALQVAALIIFLVQMSFALQKYFSKPSMKAGKTKNIMSVASPILITICKIDQWDQNIFEQIGYPSEGSYYKGKTSNKSIISWTGIFGNLTGNETLSFLFDPKMDRIDTNSMYLPAEIRTILPIGQCKSLQETPRKILKSNPESHRYAYGNVSIFIKSFVIFNQECIFN